MKTTVTGIAAFDQAIAQMPDNIPPVHMVTGTAGKYALIPVEPA